MDSTRRLFLASSSPRRAAILRLLGVPFEILEVEADEPRTDDPVESAALAALAKHTAARTALAARCVRADAAKAPSCERYGLVTADTLVFCAGKVLGKPRDRDDAMQTLLSLAGRTHQVFTAVALSTDATDGPPSLLVEASSVRFKPLSRADVGRYVDLAAPFDRAGSYDIDSHGELLVESITGSYTNVMGLPAEAIAPWLAAEGCGTPNVAGIAPLR